MTPLNGHEGFLPFYCNFDSHRYFPEQNGPPPPLCGITLRWRRCKSKKNPSCWKQSLEFYSLLRRRGNSTIFEFSDRSSAKTFSYGVFGIVYFDLPCLISERGKLYGFLIWFSHCFQIYDSAKNITSFHLEAEVYLLLFGRSTLTEKPNIGGTGEPLILKPNQKMLFINF